VSPGGRAPLRAWFTPALLGLHAFWAVALVVCLLGGFWQLGVYESRQGDALDEARRSGEAVAIGDVWELGQPFTTDLQNQSVRVTGRFADDQFWVDGPMTGGRAWLVAPFEVEGSDGALLVVRGSAARPGAFPTVPSGDQTVTVVLQPSVGGGSTLDADRSTTGLTVASLLNQLPQRLWSGYGVVTDGSPAPDGLTLVPPPDPDVSWTVGLKNLAYALQWWVFAAFAVFMWWRMTSEQVGSLKS